MWTNSFHSKATKQLWDLLKMGATQKNKLGGWQDVESRVLWVCTPNGCVYIRASVCTLGTFALSGVPSVWILLLVWLLVPRVLGLAFTASLCWSLNQGACDCWCFYAPETVCWAHHRRKLRFFSWISGSPNNSGHSLKLHYFFQAPLLPPKLQGSAHLNSPFLQRGCTVKIILISWGWVLSYVIPNGKGIKWKSFQGLGLKASSVTNPVAAKPRSHITSPGFSQGKGIFTCQTCYCYHQSPSLNSSQSWCPVTCQGRTDLALLPSSTLLRTAVHMLELNFLPRG